MFPLQDTSRAFLCGDASSHKKMYSLFMEATSLDTMQDSLLRAQGFMAEMKTAVAAVKEAHRWD